MTERATGLLIIRAWVEGASIKPLRAHVTSTKDVALGVQHEQNFADADEVCAFVNEWLAEVTPT